MPKRSLSSTHAETLNTLWEKALLWKAHEWRHELVKLLPIEVEKVTPACDVKFNHSHWKEFLAAAVSGLNDRPHLEALGRALSLTQSHEIFSYIKKDQGILDKLSPIFVGMPHDIFREVLFTMSREELELLKQEALTEAIQYHLTLVINELTAENASLENEIIKLGKKVSSIPLENITQNDINKVEKQIDHLIDQGLHWITIANSALSIAWNTLRLDLIEQLSQVKESFQRMIHNTIGSPKSTLHPASGIYAILENRLFTKFTESLSGEHFLSLPDETPAIEALVKLGIWYEQDYVCIGLIPSEPYGNAKEAAVTGEERQAQREWVYLTVTENLRSLGLNTLSDLKSRKIFSKQALQDYIKSCRS